MVPLKENLFKVKDRIKAIGGEWNGHIWCVPPNVSYTDFINYMPDKLVQRMNYYNNHANSDIEGCNDQIVLAWSMRKSIMKASLMMIMDEIDAGYMAADELYELITDYIREIEWVKIEKALQSARVESFKEIQLAGKEKHLPHGIYIWSDDFGNEAGWSNMFDDTSFHSTGPAYELYLSDELEFIFFEIEGNEFYRITIYTNTSRKPVDDENTKQKILTRFINNMIDCGKSYTEEIIDIISKA